MRRNLGFALTLAGLLFVGWLALGSVSFLSSAAPGKPTPTRVATRAAPTAAPTSTAAPSATPSSRPATPTPAPASWPTTIAAVSPTSTLDPRALLPPGPTPAVQISPPVLHLEPGQTFELQVLVYDPKVTRGAQFGLSFNPTLLELTGVDAGTYYHDWARDHGASTMAIGDVQIDASQGEATPFAVVILGGAPGGPTGPGLLATIRGRAKASVSGRAPVTLTDVVLSESRLDGAGSMVDAQSAPVVAVGNAIVAVGSASGPLPPAPTPLVVRQTPPAGVASGAEPSAVTPPPTWTPARAG
jgi:hypothetical protein